MEMRKGDRKKRQAKIDNLDIIIGALINLKIFSFWDITPRNSLEVDRRFGRICRLHLQGLRICQTRNQRDLSHFSAEEW
jgi:hypothetical protein